MMLLDTSGLFTLMDRSEPAHLLALAFYNQAPRKLITSYILAELVALAHTRRVRRELALGYVAAFTDSPKIEVIWVDERLHRAGVELLTSRPDKEYSLCDAVSFVVMRDRKIMDALTTDRHFEQEGFHRLLGSTRP